MLAALTVSACIVLVCTLILTLCARKDAQLLKKSSMWTVLWEVTAVVFLQTQEVQLHLYISVQMNLHVHLLYHSAMCHYLHFLFYYLPVTSLTTPVLPYRRSAIPMYTVLKQQLINYLFLSH